MITINKNIEPPEVATFKRQHPGIRYKKLPSKPKTALRRSLLQEQGFVCCYCGLRIGSMEASGFVPLAHDEKPSGKHGRIDHIIPQSVDPSKSMDYSNLCFSCPAEWGQPKGHMYTHCDRHKAADLLPITPLQDDCLDNFIFASTGHVLPSCAEVAKDFFLTRDILNLDVGHLVTRRQLFIEALEEVLSEEDIENVRSRYATRDANGMFPEFYFIAISIIDRQLGKK